MESSLYIFVQLCKWFDFETIERLAWSLYKDDMQINEVVHFLKVENHYTTLYVSLVSKSGESSII